ncbi:hypothetical protein PIB30_070585 [Stylosanthes scabra]|uniref:Uncharacterized protein n=1 Tax=Stylosanthes scabra TaxID=79078 RepID=A0ABU6WLX3_9FABA|nr:hypothetical protein [Stylosanthes scabra]
MDGLSTNFWENTWIKDIGRLKDYATEEINDLNSSVWEWTDGNNEWDYQKLKQHLLEMISKIIIEQPLPRAEKGQDVLAWQHTGDGDFAKVATYGESVDLTQLVLLPLIGSHYCCQDFEQSNALINLCGMGSRTRRKKS